MRSSKDFIKKEPSNPIIVLKIIWSVLGVLAMAALLFWVEFIW